MSAQHLRWLSNLATALAIGGAVGTCAAPIAWRTAEQRRWKQTYLRIHDLQYVVETWAGKHNGLPEASTAADLIALGIPPLRIFDTKPERSAVDGWGRPILYRHAYSTINGQVHFGYMLASSGADGTFEPVTAALLEVPANRADLFESRGLTMQQEDMSHAIAAMNTPWHEQTKADLVTGSVGHILGLREGTSIPPDVQRSARLRYGIPALVFTIVAIILFRASRGLEPHSGS
ncbi:MAG: hypothetical protein QOK37_4741 [Thermoanaerobaculia bacterium]|jgi:hypothetical protein|nr:hypothetical protein [Thermoanaerobaculia bacterium]